MRAGFVKAVAPFDVPVSIDVLGIDGDVITDDRLTGRVVSSISTETQSYNGAFWTKNPEDNFLTGTQITFSTDQLITIYLQ